MKCENEGCRSRSSAVEGVAASRLNSKQEKPTSMKEQKRHSQILRCCALGTISFSSESPSVSGAKKRPGLKKWLGWIQRVCKDYQAREIQPYKTPGLYSRQI